MAVTLVTDSPAVFVYGSTLTRTLQLWSSTSAALVDMTGYTVTWECWSESSTTAVYTAQSASISTTTATFTDATPEAALVTTGRFYEVWRVNDGSADLEPFTRPMYVLDWYPHQLVRTADLTREYPRLGVYRDGTTDWEDTCDAVGAEVFRYVMANTRARDARPVNWEETKEWQLHLALARAWRQKAIRAQDFASERAAYHEQAAMLARRALRLDFDTDADGDVDVASEADAGLSIGPGGLPSLR